MKWLRRVNMSLVRTLLVVSLLAAGAVIQVAVGNTFASVSADATSGTATPEEAARNMFRACCRRSPQLFIQTRLLGVCDGGVDTLNKYAESLHLTEFDNGNDALTVYDLPKRMKEDSIRVIAGQAFNEKDVDTLEVQFLSTYYAKELMCFDVAADNYDGATYQTRIVVAKHSDRWYAIPRCRSSKSFYEIAGAMRLN